MSAAFSKAVVLLSGGLDSYTAGAIAREAGFELYALTVKYGQRHRSEEPRVGKGGPSKWRTWG
jgi:7-cyano-7-deazaguanine synthase